jgi:hypothetical protein
VAPAAAEPGGYTRLIDWMMPSPARAEELSTGEALALTTGAPLAVRIVFTGASGLPAQPASASAKQIDGRIIGVSLSQPPGYYVPDNPYMGRAAR